MIHDAQRAHCGTVSNVTGSNERVIQTKTFYMVKPYQSRQLVS